MTITMNLPISIFFKHRELNIEVQELRKLNYRHGKTL